MRPAHIAPHMLGCLVALFGSDPIWIHREGRGGIWRSHKFHSLVNSQRCPSSSNSLHLLYAQPMCRHCPQYCRNAYIYLYVNTVLSWTEPWCDHLRALNLRPLSLNIVVAVVKLVELVRLDVCKFWYQRPQLFGFQQIRGDANMCMWHQYQRRRRWNRYWQ